MAPANAAVAGAPARARPFAPYDVACEHKKSQDGICILPSLYASDWFAKSPNGRIGSLLAMYCVFDGHKDATAMEYLEKHWTRNVEHEARVLAARGAGAGSGDDGIESAFQRVLQRMESEYGTSNNVGCFFCNGNTPEGGATVNVVAVQCVPSPPGDGRKFALDLVCANVGDSGALMLPHPAEFDSISADDRSLHVRLSREHNPDDPFEARRLISSECRLARLRGDNGQELGPLRVYPGGYAISRAFGDFDSPGIICEPEFTRVHVPAVGCRLLVASDGVFSALKDSEIAQECFRFMGPDTCARGIVDKVMRTRGKHDDITCIVVDIPSYNTLEALMAEAQQSLEDVEIVTKWMKKRVPLTREQTLEIESAESECSDDIDVTVHAGRNFGDFSAKKLYDDFDVEDLIGRGVYGSVRKGKSRKTGETVAIKSILRSRVDAALIQDECDVLQVLCGHHPSFPEKLMVYEDSHALKSEVTHIVTDLYTGGTLLEGIEQRGLFDEGDWCVIANELLGAVSFMHSLGVAHRDLKPDNIMLVKPWSKQPGSIPIIKLIDFGSATFCMAHETLKGHVGTKFFSAPECLRRQKYTKKCDVWSLGVILLVLITGFPNGLAVEQQWRELHSGATPKFPESVPKHFKKLIQACLIMDQTRRPSCGSILRAANEWLGTSFSSNSIISSPMKSRPARRLAIPHNFSDAVRSYNGAAHDALSRSGKGNQEEEDISRHEGNHWQLDLNVERGDVVGTAQPLAIIDTIVAENQRVAYQKHVTDMLSIVASPQEIRAIIDCVRKSKSRSGEGQDARNSSDGVRHAEWCSAITLEESARVAGALDSSAQLVLARHLTGMDASDLWIDLEILEQLDTLHERHKHVFNAIEKFAKARKVTGFEEGGANLDTQELSAVDDNREMVQGDAHSGMVRAMMSRGLSSYNLSATEKTPIEPSDLTVRGGSAWFWEDWSDSGGGGSRSGSVRNGAAAAAAAAAAATATASLKR